MARPLTPKQSLGYLPFSAGEAVTRPAMYRILDLTGRVGLTPFALGVPAPKVCGGSLPWVDQRNRETIIADLNCAARAVIYVESLNDTI